MALEVEGRKNRDIHRLFSTLESTLGDAVNGIDARFVSCTYSDQFFQEQSQNFTKKHTSLLAGNIFKLSFNHGTKYEEAFAFMHPYVVNCNLSSAVVIRSEGDKFLKKLLCCVGGRV